MRKFFVLLLVFMAAVSMISCASTGAASENSSNTIESGEFDGEYKTPILCEVYYTQNNPVWRGRDEERSWPRLDELILTPRDSDLTKGHRYSLVINVIDFQYDVCELIVSFNNFKDVTHYKVSKLPTELQTWIWWNNINILGSTPREEFVSAYAVDLQGNKSNIIKFNLKTVKENNLDRPASNRD